MKRASTEDFLSIPLLNVRPHVSSTPPANPQAGQLWTDTSVTPAVLRWHDGNKWVAADGTSIPAGFITDNHISQTANISLSKLAMDPLDRGNHTGTQLSNTISDFDTRVRSNRLDQLTAPTASVDLNGQRIANLANPVSSADAVTKAYVDNSRAGISVKDPVRVAANGNVNLSAPGATVDGVALAEGDRFLAPSQHVGTQNGVYVYHGADDPATRATDADGAGEVFDGSMLAVAEGSHAGYQFIQTGTASGAPGTWTQTWTVFQTGGQTYIAGNGLTLSGTTFSLDAPVSIANGGTGASSATAARLALGGVGKFTANCAAMTAGVTYNLTHGLNTTEIGAWFKTADDGRVIDIDWAPSGVNAVALYPDINFAAGAIRAVVVG